MSMPDLNQGALAPVADEYDGQPLAVKGEIPPQLNGTLVRNGPNPLSGRFEGTGVLSWWPEAAMLHGISFANGEVTRYRNRWARTQNWASYFEPEAREHYIDTNPNVNVIHHADTTLALAEGGPPLAITRELDTVGLSKAHPSLRQGMTAHPKLDPQRQELRYFRANWAAPFLHYGVVDATGKATCEQEIEVPAPAMMHDMAITDSHSILMDLNVGYDFALLQQGYRLPLCWLDERQSRLGLLPRLGGSVTWIEIEPCFIQHVVNSYNRADGRIVLDVVRYPGYFKLDRANLTYAPDPLGVLWRYVIDPLTASVQEQQLDDRSIELPRINEGITGSEHRYFYAVEQPTAEEMRGILRYDLETGTQQRHSVSPGDQNSEPVFVPRPGAVQEDDGWVLVCVYRQASATTEVRILSAADLAAEPLATIDVGRRIPAGFHGAWLPTT